MTWMRRYASGVAHRVALTVGVRQGGRLRQKRMAEDAVVSHMFDCTVSLALTGTVIIAGAQWERCEKAPPLGRGGKGEPQFTSRTLSLTE